MRNKVRCIYENEKLTIVNEDKTSLKIKLNGTKINTDKIILSEGDLIRIGNQIKDWYIEKAPDGRFIFYHDTFEEKGYKIYEDNIYLFALTSGSARNGLFHKYRPAKNSLEEYLKNCGISTKIIEYMEDADFNMSLEIGKSGIPGKCEVETHICTDGEFEQSNSGSLFETIDVKSAKYIILYSEHINMNKSYKNIDKIYISQKAKFNDVVNKCIEIKG